MESLKLLVIKFFNKLASTLPYLATAPANTAIVSVIALGQNQLQGALYMFSENGEQLAVCSTYDNSYLYDLSGNQLAQFQGIFSKFSTDRQRVITFSERNSTSYLYDLSGSQLAQFQGRHHTFSRDGQWIMVFFTNHYSYLYNRFGNQLARFQDGEPLFSVDGQQVLISSIEHTESYLYDLSGNQLAQFQGGHPRACFKT